MAFCGVVQYYDFVSLMTQEVFSCSTLYVRNFGFVNGERALNAEMLGSWGATHCCDRTPGALECAGEV